KIALLVSVKDSKILDKVISAAKKIETRNYYKNAAVERNTKDSGAAASFITKKLMDKLGLKIEKRFITIIITAT
ncbi:8331_t:CDS:2, partial [Cetraspora pellucida]